MASTTAFFTGLSGLNANARWLEVIGNNISNINTTAFKSSRLQFEPAFSRNFALGTAPGTDTGGTNPTQVGLGVQIAGVQRNFNNGSISSTGVTTDLAIEGDGLFVIDLAGEQLFTRAGAFQLNANSDLVTIGGGKVQGFGIDSQFQIVSGALVDLNIPVGLLTLAEATRNVNFSGNLNASGVVATTGSVHESRAFFTDSGLTPGMEMLGTENLSLPVAGGGSDLYISDGASSSFLAIEGGSQAIVTISGAEKFGADLGTHTFGFMTAAEAAAAGVDDFGSTMNDFLVFMDQVMGLDSTVISGQDLGGQVRISTGALGDPPAGTIIIEGNEGLAQDLDIETANLAVTYAILPVGMPISQPFVMTETGQADGESGRTSFVVFDSLGTPLTIDLTFVLQQTTLGGGTTWEFIVESGDNDALDRILGLGVVTFDDNGRFVSATNQAFSVIRSNGAVTPLTVNMEFDNGTDAISALTSGNSTLAAVFQDGSSIGTLSSFSIGEDGILTGAFTNGLQRNLGQVALANFINPGGLIDEGSNFFRAGPNSGLPLINKPLEFGNGRLLGGALELSNVDLSEEFINMILASTGYSAASRIITTTDELLDLLLLLGR